MNNKNNSFLEEVEKESEILSETENQTDPKISSKPDFNSKTNKLFFEQILETRPTKESIQEKLGEFHPSKESEQLDSEQEKKETYEKLGIKDLPDDWKEQLDRIPQLEANQEKHQPSDLKPIDYEQIKQELSEWNNTFQQKTAFEVDNEIKKLSQRPAIDQATWEDYQNRQPLTEFKEISNKLKEWEDNFTNQTAQEVKNELIVLTEREKELKEWHQDFPQQNSKEVKAKIEQLNQRPNISLQEWNDKQSQAQQLTQDLEQTNQNLKTWTNTFKNQEPNQVQTEIDNLKKEWTKRNQEYHRSTEELEKWQKTLESQDPKAIKNRLKELNKRPDIPITAEQWWNDYSGRKSHEQSQQEQKAWEQDKKQLQNYEKDLKNLLAIKEIANWKAELAKIKNEKDNLEHKIKLIIECPEKEDLPNEWLSQLTNTNQVKFQQKQLEQKARELKSWMDEFPKKTPYQVTQQLKINQKPIEQLKEWTEAFPDRTAKGITKEIKNKESEINILKKQVEELGGTVGANPSEKLIESKLREIIVAEDWNLGYLIQVLKKFLEWREIGTSEQKKAIIKYWIVINKNLTYLEQRNKQSGVRY